METQDDIVPVADLRLCLLRLARRIRQNADPGITPSQMSALSTVARSGPVDLGELAERERISKATVTRLVPRLEEMGLLARASDPRDGRRAIVSVTDEGRKLLADSTERADVYLSRQLAALSAEDRALLALAVPVLERLLKVKA